MGSANTPTGSVRVLVGVISVMPTAQKRTSEIFFEDFSPKREIAHHAKMRLRKFFGAFFPMGCHPLRSGSKNFLGAKIPGGPKQRGRAMKGWEERSGGRSSLFLCFFHLLLSFLPSLLLWGLLVYTSYKCYMEIQMEEVKK